MRNQKFLHLLSLALPFYMHITTKFSHLSLEHSTNLISLYTTNTNSPTTDQTSSPNIVRDTIRICLPFRMFQTDFNKLHEHYLTGIKITYNTFSQYYNIPFLEKWLSIFIHDCIECQRNKHFNMKIQIAPTIFFRTCSIFQLPYFYGYKRTYQSSFTQQILQSSHN